MDLRIEPVSVAAIAGFLEAFRAKADVQIVADSILPRGMADCYRIHFRGEPIGYGGVWNCHTPGRLMQFYLAGPYRSLSTHVLDELVRASGAFEMEAQTNLEPMFALLRAHCMPVETLKLLFGNPHETSLKCPDVKFRGASPDEMRFPGHAETAEFVLECGTQIVGSGGYLCHYNPPYADVFMEIQPEFRGRGYGSFLVQEIRRACQASGKIPAARSDPANVGSHRALANGGLPPIGKLLAGKIRLP